MHLFHISKCTIQNKTVHTFVLNDALWDMEQVHFGICEVGLLCPIVQNAVFFAFIFFIILLCYAKLGCVLLTHWPLANVAVIPNM